MLTSFILPGLLVGIGAALSPGPIILLVISETLRGGIKSGLSVAVAPLITDLPFVIASILLAQGLGSFRPFIGVISLIGAAFLCFLAYQNVTITREELRRPAGARGSLLKGVVTNLLSPYLYIFWFSVALPVFAKGNLAGSGLFAASLLLASLTCLSTVALLVSVARTRFTDHLHWVLRVMSVLLFLIALMFVREGLRLLW